MSKKRNKEILYDSKITFSINLYTPIEDLTDPTLRVKGESETNSILKSGEVYLVTNTEEDSNGTVWKYLIKQDTRPGTKEYSVWKLNESFFNDQFKII